MRGEASRVTAKFEDEYLSLNGIIVTLGARGFSCAVSHFGQVLKKSDPREKYFFAASPLVSSAFGRTRVSLRPTKRNSPSHARKNRWYPGYIIVRCKLKKGSLFYCPIFFLHIHSATIVYESMSLLRTLATVIKNCP